MSPTQRSMAYLRSKGAHCAIVEHWNSFAGIRIDLYGWIDIVAIYEDEFYGIQTTIAANSAARMHKARGNPALQAWMRAGGLLVVHAWAMRGAKGKRKLWGLKEWFLRPEDVLEDGPLVT